MSDPKLDPRYLEWRKDIEEFFAAVPVAEPTETSTSPDGRFRLEIAEYTGDGKYFSRGIVRRLANSEMVADVKRNYSDFWYRWISHPNGNEYLLCGEDYQGHSCVNLTDGAYHVDFPDDGYRGAGFCWTAAYPSPDGLVLAVDGCYWGCDYELVFFDFRDPDRLPYPELGRAERSTYGIEGWTDDETFAYTHLTSLRASDGVEYGSLSDEEKAELRRNPSLVSRREDRIVSSRPQVLDGPESTTR